VVAFTATTTAVAGLLQFKQFAADLSLTPPIGHAPVIIADPGSPQTLLLIGSDHRAGQKFSASNTDTMMLVRMDPSSSTINVLSVPRDLKVLIPEQLGMTTAKLNAAYSVGGPGLLVKVLRQQVFPSLRVNHIIDVNFGGFEALVNAIGCVYADVDRRYYNNTALTNYSSINIQAGYQKLCGSDALAFVRFRHTDNDFVRNARQQDFLRWAKSQYTASALIAHRDSLLKLFGSHTETDSNLHSIDGLINLFNLVAFSAGHTIKQVHFPGYLLPCPQQAVGQTPCYVSADPHAERQAFQDFMAPTVAVAGSGTSASPAPGSAGGGASRVSNLIADRGGGRAQAAALGRMEMPVLIPRLLAKGSTYETAVAGQYPRKYTLRDRSGAPHAAYRMVLTRGDPLLGQYYGVQGTTWQNPPILSSPNEIRTVAGKRLALYFNGHKLALVAWHTPQAAYWISNTLTDDLDNQQMLGVAGSLSRG
jgi:LCP family protein required for cell wall assembly